ncbi:AAA family ATPase, partial [Streptomyces synnematoformans]|uniref:AAA family ATPase n=1 Tax=Streptomyces synnematoformans TaxID=415721 RepID=UPI0031DFFB6D
MAPLVGRAGTLSVLGGHLDAAAQGRGGCVVVEGPLGIGRSRLLRATAREGAERGLTVVGGRAGGNRGTPASEGVAGGGRPLPVDLLTNYLRRVLATDVDDLVRPDGNPFRLMDRVGELVETAARRHPLVVLLDDVHRVDDMGGLALRGLVQSLAGSPVLWLLTRRPVPTRSLTQHAVDRLIDGAAVRLHLGALDNEAVAELCTGLLGAKPDSSVLGWAARCGGNPWLLTRVFDALVTAGRVVFVDGTAAVLGEQLPDAVLDTVRKLVDGLPTAMARLLVAGAGIGEAFTAAQAAAPAASADEAVRTGLLQRHGEELAFAHGVVAEALRHPALRRTGPVPGRPTAAGEALPGPAQASGTPETGGSAQPPGPVMAPGQVPANGPAAASGAPQATGPTPAYDLAQASAPVPTAAPAAAPGTRQATGPLPAYGLAQPSGPVPTSGAAAASGSPQTHDPVPTPGPAQASGPVPTAGPAAASGTPQATGPAPAYAQASASGAAPDRVPDAYRRQPRPLPPEDSPAVPPPAAVCGCEGTVAAAVAALADRSGAAPRALARAL